MSRSEALAFDGPPVQLHQLAHDRQSKPAEGAMRRTVGLSEAIEHVRDEGRLDANARVRHQDLNHRIRLSYRHANPAVPRRELDGIRHQIPNHLLHPRGVCQYAGNAWVGLVCQQDVLRGNRGLEDSMNRRMDRSGTARVR